MSATLQKLRQRWLNNYIEESCLAGAAQQETVFNQVALQKAALRCASSFAEGKQAYLRLQQGLLPPLMRGWLAQVQPLFASLAAQQQAGQHEGQDSCARLALQ